MGQARARQHVPDLRLRVGSQAGRCIVTFHLGSGPVSWAYDPASGSLIRNCRRPWRTRIPSAVSALSLRRIPGSSAARVIGDLDGDGVATFMPNIPAGNYDIVVSVPAHAISTKGTGAVGRTAAGATSTPEPSSKKHVSNIKWTPGKAKVGITTLTFHITVQPPQPQENSSNKSSPVSHSNVANNRMAATSAPVTVRVQRIEMDSSHPPTVVVGSGTSSSQ